MIPCDVARRQKQRLCILQLRNFSVRRQTGSTETYGRPSSWPALIHSYMRQTILLGLSPQAYRSSVNCLGLNDFTYSDTRWPCDHTMATLTGMSLPLCKVNVTFAFVDLWFDEWTTNLYWGLTIKLGCVQFPPAFLEDRDPSIFVTR